MRSSISSFDHLYSGPKRFDYDTTTGKWTYSRDGSVLQDLLREELTDIVGSDVTIR